MDLKTTLLKLISGELKPNNGEIKFNNNILENTIDLIVNASKNEININNRETQKRLIQCFSFSLRILARLITMCRIKKNKNK